MRLEKATLIDGSSIDYIPEPIGEGAEKIAYFTPDRRSVVLLYKDRPDAERIMRLDAILGRYNPTLGHNGAYWSQLFCWPLSVVVAPSMGIVTSAYPSNFFFSEAVASSLGWDKPKEKKGSWFASRRLRRMLPPGECGHFLNYLRIAILMARAVGRLHSAGLAHSDLSPSNVLIDPTLGICVVIDIDTLVVPGVHPPKVLGTPGYIAPEVVAGQGQILPSIATDLHALAVLIYEYLLLRHPLRGPRIVSSASAEEDDHLQLGEEALFIEHPTDHANRPTNLTVAYEALGPYIAAMVRRTFVDGLHAANERPTAIEWERALMRTTDLLLPCASASCEAKWFVLDTSSKLQCPFCRTPYGQDVPILNFYSERRTGQYSFDQHRMAVWDKLSLYKWHLFGNVWPGADADRTPQGYFVFHQGKWLLVNQSESSMNVLNSSPVLPGQAVELQDGQQIQLATSSHGRLALVQMLRA